MYMFSGDYCMASSHVQTGGRPIHRRPPTRRSGQVLLTQWRFRSKTRLRTQPQPYGRAIYTDVSQTEPNI